MKYFKYIVFLFLMYLVGVMNVKASEFYCLYDVGIDVTVYYKYGTTPRVSKSSTKDEVSFKITNQDLIVNGEPMCPNVSLTQTPYGKQRYIYDLKIDANGKYTGTLNVVVLDDKEKGDTSQNYSCVYNKGKDTEYTLSWSDELIYTIKGSKIKDYTIQIKGSFSKNDFLDNKCPVVYDQPVTKGKIFIISKNSIMTENDKETNADITINNNNSTENQNKNNGAQINGTGNNIVDDIDLEHFCQSSVLGVFTILGWVFFILKILIPILLIIFGSIDFTKAILAGKDDAIKKSAKTLILRTVAGIIIFFIPTIISTVVNIFDTPIMDTDGDGINDAGLYKGTFLDCTNCMLEPWNSSCKGLGE